MFSVLLCYIASIASSLSTDSPRARTLPSSKNLRHTHTPRRPIARAQPGHGACLLREEPNPFVQTHPPQARPHNAIGAARRTLSGAPATHSIAWTPSYAGRRLHASVQSIVPPTSSMMTPMTSSMSPMSCPVVSRSLVSAWR